MTVAIVGEVRSPGVYTVPASERLRGLLAAAGGPTDQADLEAVNLASELTDAEQYRVPALIERLGAPVPPAVGSSGPPGQGVDASQTTLPIINLNTADISQLDVLPGVGPATAAAIVEHRVNSGPFATVDDLLNVPGIGEAKLARLRTQATV